MIEFSNSSAAASATGIAHSRQACVGVRVSSSTRTSSPSIAAALRSAGHSASGVRAAQATMCRDARRRLGAACRQCRTRWL